MSIYPLPMRFPVPMDGSSGRKAREADRALERGEYIDVRIAPTGWDFILPADRETFERLPVAARLTYRKAFEAQVALAKETPA
jgi:hypothetical protein